MAESVLKLRVESQEYESKIKRAAAGLQSLGTNLRNAGKTFADVDKEQLKFIQELGKMETVSKTAKGKVNELSTAFIDLSAQYKRMTEQERSSPAGKAMAASLEQLKLRTIEAKQELAGFQAQLNTVSKSGGQFNQLLGGVAGKFGMSASMFTGVGATVAGIGAAYKAISDNISTAMGFEKSMSQLSSLTGMVGKDLEQLKEYAIELGSTSTLTASQVADTFRLIGSQQPQLLSSADALKEVTKNAITLSEAAGIDLVTAAQTLSTSINQMGGDSDNAARYVNVLAAASQKGAGDIAWLGEAITKSATAAKAVGTDYEELVANLEQLAKGGFDASTAGTALRSIIMNLEKQANQEFKPSIVGLTQAFENLGKANLDIVGYQEIAGKMFASQAKVLADAAGEARNMTTAITGTNTATQQASTNTANLEGSLKSLASAWEGLNLHINSSNGYLKTAVDWLKDVVVWADKAIAGLGEVKGNRDKLNGEGNGSQTKVDRMVGNLENTSIDRRQSIYTQQVSAYWKYINEWDRKLKEAESRKDVFAWETIKKNNDIAEAKANIAGAQSMLKEYQSKAQKLLKTSSPSPGKGGSNNGIVVDVDVDTEEGTKSIKELQNEIKKLKKLRDDAASAGDTKLRDQYNAQIKSVQAEIKSIRGTGSTSTNHKVKTEEQLNNDEIQKLTQEYIKASDDRQASIREEIKVLQDRNAIIQTMKDEALGKRLPVGDMDTASGIAPTELINPFEKYKETVISIKTPLQALTEEMKRLAEAQALALTPEQWSAYQTQIEEVQKKMGTFKGDGKSTAKEWGGAAQAINAVGSAMQSIEDPAAKVAGTIAQAIATIALTYAKSLEGTFTPWDWIAAAASGAATMISVISSIHSATGYANGGIVKGTSYSGDNIPALVDGSQMVGLNAGEVVLNASMQNTLAQNLQGSGLQNLSVSGEISGESIKIVLNRHLKRTGQGELVTW